jgi:hypothetical protein
MSQKINHRRGEGRHQDNGPRWENGNPMAGCNSTHVARSRSAWRTIGRRLERRTGKHAGVRYRTGGARQVPAIDEHEIEEYEDDFMGQ